MKFKNFKVNEIKGHQCNYRCENAFTLFSVFNNGKCNLFEWSLNEIATWLKKEKSKLLFYDITKDDYADYPSKFKWSVALAYENKVKVKNCFICRYHGDNINPNRSDSEDRDKPIFCKFLKVRCASNKAANCEYYRPERNYIDEYLQQGKSELINARAFTTSVEDEIDYNED